MAVSAESVTVGGASICWKGPGGSPSEPSKPPIPGILDEAQTQYRVKLEGIDAPEARQPFGQTSKEHLSQLVGMKQVMVDQHKRDRYGRIVGKVLVDDSDACLAQIQAGLAW